MIPIVPIAERWNRPASDVVGGGPALGGVRLAALPPLGLYIHIPWCVRKCPYCDFNSHEHPGGVDAIPETGYVDALIADLEQTLPLVWGRRVHSIFIGGGTPSLFSAEAIDSLLCRVRALLPVEADAEVTLEANPGVVEAGRFADFRGAGVNRISIGVQSFDDRALVALGRIHDRAQAVRAIELAQRDFANVNLDVMYALPGQTLGESLLDLNHALAFEPAHLSLYHLTLEPNTVFAKFPPLLPDHDAAATMQEAIEDRAQKAGYRHYEISAFSKAGLESRHNLNYWNFGDYLGIGAGAHAKISFAHRIVRQVRYRQPAAYLEHLGQKHSALAEEYDVAAVELPFEFMLNALRLVDGFPTARFAERTGLSILQVQTQLDAAETAGLIERDFNRIKPTLRGRRFLNDLVSLFLVDEGDAPK